MSTNSFFDITRLKYLLIRQLSFNYKANLIATGVIVGIMIFSGTMMLLFSDQIMTQQIFLGMIMPYFFIGGYIFSSLIFSELNSPNKGYLFLTLPASTFEKLLSAWLSTSVFYILFISVIMYILNFYYWAIASSFTSKTVELMNLFSPGVLKVFGVYIVTQSVFLLGSIYFRKVHFLKTILALFVIAFIIAIFSGIMARILFSPTSFQNMSWMNNMNFDHSFDFKYTAEHVIVPIAKVLFWGCIAPFFLVVSYFRLKEREV